MIGYALKRFLSETFPVVAISARRRGTHRLTATLSCELSAAPRVKSRDSGIDRALVKAAYSVIVGNTPCIRCRCTTCDCRELEPYQRTAVPTRNPFLVVFKTYLMRMYSRTGSTHFVVYCSCWL